MMTAMDYITSAFADVWATEDPHHITKDESASMISEWTVDGMPCPPSVTPLLFCRTWNVLCDKHIGKEAC